MTKNEIKKAGFNIASLNSNGVDCICAGEDKSAGFDVAVEENGSFEVIHFSLEQAREAAEKFGAEHGLAWAVEAAVLNS